MLHIDSRSLEPLPRPQNPPDHDHSHRRSIHQRRPVHRLHRKIPSRDRRQTHDGRHERDKRARYYTNGPGQLSKMPWPRLETSRCHEHADEDGDGESDEGSNSADTEECAGCKSPAQNEEEQDYADAAIDDDGVDGGACAGVYGRYEFAEGKDTVAGVCEGNAGCGDHAALTHGEAGDDGESEDGEGDGLRENLDSIGGEGLA